MKQKKIILWMIVLVTLACSVTAARDDLCSQFHLYKGDSKNIMAVFKKK